MEKRVEKMRSMLSVNTNSNKKPPVKSPQPNYICLGEKEIKDLALMFRQ